MTNDVRQLKAFIIELATVFYLLYRRYVTVSLVTFGSEADTLHTTSFYCVRD